MLVSTVWAASLQVGTDSIFESSAGFGRGMGGPIGAFNAAAYPIEPLKAGQWYVKLNPGYWRDSEDTNIFGTTNKYSVEGVGFSAELLYSFTDHWGVNLSAAYATVTNGTSAAVNVNVRENRLNVPAEGSGFTSVVSAVYDHFEGDNFRLPIWVGVGYFNFDNTAEGTFQFKGNTIHTRSHNDKTAPIFIGGLAPQWNWGLLRIVPFGNVAHIPGALNVSGLVENLSTGQRNETRGEVEPVKTVAILGATIKYRPWNLGLTFARGGIGLESGKRMFVGDPSIFTVTWDRKF
jgi:hypothetical protein